MDGTYQSLYEVLIEMKRREKIEKWRKQQQVSRWAIALYTSHMA